MLLTNVWFTMKGVAVSGLAKIAGALSTTPVKKCGLSIAHMIATVPPWKKKNKDILKSHESN